MTYRFSPAKFCSESFTTLFDTESLGPFTQVFSRGEDTAPPRAWWYSASSAYTPHKPPCLSFQLRLSSSGKFFPLRAHEEQLPAARFALDDTTPGPTLTPRDGCGTN